MRKSIFILILLGFGMLTSCSTSEDTPSDFLRLVPQQTAVILKSYQLSDFFSALKETPLIAQNENLPLFQFLINTYAPAKDIRLGDNSLLLCSSIDKDEITLTLITSQPGDLPKTLSDHQTRQFDYNGEIITTYEVNGQTSYSASLKGIFVWGNSKLVTENIIRLSKENLEPDHKLQKLYETTSRQKPAVLIHLKEFQKLYRQHLLPN